MVALVKGEVSTTNHLTEQADQRFPWTCGTLVEAKLQYDLRSNWREMQVSKRERWKRERKWSVRERFGKIYLTERLSLELASRERERE